MLLLWITFISILILFNETKINTSKKYIFKLIKDCLTQIFTVLTKNYFFSKSLLKTNSGIMLLAFVITKKKHEFDRYDLWKLLRSLPDRLPRAYVNYNNSSVYSKISHYDGYAPNYFFAVCFIWFVISIFCVFAFKSWRNVVIHLLNFSGLLLYIIWLTVLFFVFYFRENDIQVVAFTFDAIWPFSAFLHVSAVLIPIFGYRSISILGCAEDFSTNLRTDCWEDSLFIFCFMLITFSGTWLLTIFAAFVVEAAWSAYDVYDWY